MVKKLNQVRRSKRIQSHHLKTANGGGGSNDVTRSRNGKRRRQGVATKKKSHWKKIDSQVLASSLGLQSPDDNEGLGSYYLVSDFPLKTVSKKKAASMVSQRVGGVNGRRPRRRRRRNLFTRTRRTRTASSSSSFQLAQGDDGFFLDEPLEKAVSPKQPPQKLQSLPSMSKTKAKSMVLEGKKVLPPKVNIRSSIKAEKQNVLEIRKAPVVAAASVQNILTPTMLGEPASSSANDKDDDQSESRQHKLEDDSPAASIQPPVVSPGDRRRVVVFSKIVESVSPTKEGKSGFTSIDTTTTTTSSLVESNTKSHQTSSQRSQSIEPQTTVASADTANIINIDNNNTANTAGNNNPVVEESGVTLKKVKECLERMHNLMSHLEDLLE